MRFCMQMLATSVVGKSVCQGLSTCVKCRDLLRSMICGSLCAAVHISIVPYPVGCCWHFFLHDCSMQPAVFSCVTVACSLPFFLHDCSMQPASSTEVFLPI